MVGNCTGGSGGGSGGSGASGGKGTSSGNNTTAARAATPARGVSLGIPNWAFLPVAIGLSAIVGLFAVPGVLSRLGERRPRSVAPPPEVAGPAGARAAFRDARLAIENGERPRDAIVRLYGRILGRVAPNLDDLAASTAEEIQQTRFAALRVPASRSAAITWMFEEARYSTHPIDRPTADRFVETLRALEQDLATVGTPR